MDEIEFRKRVYANPLSPEQDVLDAARENPDYKKILDQTQELETDVTALVTTISAPADLKEKLLAVPSQADSSPKSLMQKEAANSSYFQYYAVAATLLLAIGVTFSLTFNTGPTIQDIALGDDVLEHLYIDSEEINAFSRGDGGNFGIINASNVSQVLATAGTQLASNDFMENMPIRMAKPCEIIPAFQSAHLIIEGTQGAVSVFVINNSPVSVEYRFRDDRFNGVVVPMGKGNMILVGEENENLDQYKDLFSDNVDWVI
ncbi:MAG: DUF3379 family protein [Pseudomonadales bacterium]|nr:DUF3379 family protein [Pseudomonadales bacterium]